jgi:iron complex transport system ATP-binding protein
MKPGTPIIDIRDLRFRFKTETADVLSNFSMHVQPRTINAVLGPNGSGKTTLLRLILGFLNPDAGTILVNGSPVHAEGSAGMKRMISIVPQTERVSFELDIMEYVLLGRAPHLSLFQLPADTDRRIACQAIETVGLKHLMHRPVSSLSGGEHQLARIARALAQETDIILLDEPTAHLDLANIRIVTRIMHRLTAEGKTIVYTTNDPNIVSIAASQVFMLKNHRIMAAGPPAEVFTRSNLSSLYGIDVDIVRQDGRGFVVIPL